MILPRVLLIGCRPLVPYHGLPDPPFHSPPLAPHEVGDYQWPPEHCPTCRGKIGLRKRPPVAANEATGSDGKVEYRTDDVDPQHPESIDHLTFCLWCYGTALRNAARISRLLSYGHAKRLAASANAESARQIKDSLDRRLRGNATLTETERRRIWYGYKNAISRDLDASIVGNLALIGREWLARLDQLPDFTLILDGTGHVVGRWRQAESGEWVPHYDASYDRDEPPHRRFMNAPPAEQETVST
jgi:hypothetical protein